MDIREQFITEGLYGNGPRGLETDNCIKGGIVKDNIKKKMEEVQTIVTLPKNFGFSEDRLRAGEQLRNDFIMKRNQKKVEELGDGITVG